MKKRLCALLLCLLLALTAFPLSVLAADEPPAPAPKLALTCERLTAETAKVTVCVKNNPGIAGFEVDLQLNGTTDVLSEPEISLGEAWSQAYCDDSVDDDSVAMESESIKVAVVNGENITAEELFSVTFTVGKTDFDNLLFYASGKFCDENSAVVSVETPDSWAALYGDAMSIIFDTQTTLSMSETKVSGTMGVDICSYDSGLGRGVGYSGNAKLILACYQGGKFCGCKMQNVTLEANTCNEIKMTGVSFAITNPTAVHFQLMLVDEHFVPLMKADSSVIFTKA